MIPKKLIIQGLYSYQERQEIDFDQLCQTGFFGIFGAVGSGKSAIIEAISIVLFGKSERLKKSDKASYNFLNLKSQHLFIQFDFYRNGKLYRAERVAKRNKNDFENITNQSAFYLLQPSQDPLPLTESVEEILRMKYEYFSKTIIIAQGKFSEFIFLKPAERANMLEDIFNLHQYDLAEKVKPYLHNCQNNLQKNQGKYENFQLITTELEKSKINEIEEIIKNLETLKKEELENDKTLDSCNQINKISNEILSIENQIKSNKKAILKEKTLFDNKKNQLKKIQIEYENRATEQNDIHQLTLIEKHRQLEKEIQSMDMILNEKTKNNNEIKEAILAKKDIQKKLEIQSNAQIIIEDNIITQLNTLLTERKIKRNEYKSIENEILSKKEDIKNLEVSIETIHQKEVEQNTKEQEISELQVSVKLNDWAEKLENEKPCPLCGSTHHPNPIQPIQTSHLQKYDSQLHEIKKTIDKFKQQNIKLQEGVNTIEEKKKKQKQILNDGKLLSSIIQEVLNPYHAILEKKDEVEQYHELLEIRDKQTALEKEKHQILTEINKFNNQLNEILVEKEQLTSKKNEYVSQQKDLSISYVILEKWENTSLEELHKIANQRKQALDYIIKSYEQLEIIISTLIKNIAEKEGALKLMQNSKIALENELTQINQLRNIDNWDNIEALEKWITELEAKKKTLAEQIEQKQLNLGEGNKVLSSIQNDLKEKKTLEKEIKELEKEFSNLKILERLFKGKEFVAFVAEFYFKNLVEVANHRFMKMTSNQLQLMIKDKELYIRDIINDGKERSIKTLSGGQTFLASLCLALALSQQVQQYDSDEKKFFFIDEGFGTLDNETLEIVMKSIHTLVKEQFIIGVISHVDELKDQVNLFAEVKLDEEKGSQVVNSFDF